MDDPDCVVKRHVINALSATLVKIASLTGGAFGAAGVERILGVRQ